MGPHLSLVECYRATPYTTSASCAHTTILPLALELHPAPRSLTLHLSVCLGQDATFLPRPAALERTSRCSLLH